jgi:methylated-DNA-protein-cysteine methyltransferase-like protein
VNTKDFFSKVYNVVLHIPRGKVTTYGRIAEMIGYPNHARKVGQAMYNAPCYMNMPCHRVVNSKGELAPDHVFGGREKQYEMLLEEGVCFKENGCIDMKKSLWIAR